MIKGVLIEESFKDNKQDHDIKKLSSLFAIYLLLYSLIFLYSLLILHHLRKHMPT